MPKKNRTKGYCTLCYWLQDRFVLETTGHRFRECPYTARILGHAWRGFTSCTKRFNSCSNKLAAKACKMDDDGILYTYALPLTTGLLLSYYYQTQKKYINYKTRSKS